MLPGPMKRRWLRKLNTAIIQAGPQETTDSLKNWDTIFQTSQFSCLCRGAKKSKFFGLPLKKSKTTKEVTVDIPQKKNKKNFQYIEYLRRDN